MKKLSLLVILLAGLGFAFMVGCSQAPSGDGTPEAPTVTTRSPTPGAENVPINTTVFATFSEAMSRETVTASGAFALSSAEGAVAGSVSYNSSTNTATFTPTNNLAYSTTYSATISANVKDVAGNAMGTASTWSFKTVAATAATFTLASSGFVDGGRIPIMYAKEGVYPDLDILGAENTSIPFSWTAAPSTAESFALSMIDASNNSAHWLVVNIPTTATSLDAGASPYSLPLGADEVPNGYTAGRYEGPWPPQGVAQAHTYRFTLYALSSTLDASSITGYSSFTTAVNAVKIQSATIDGVFWW